MADVILLGLAGFGTLLFILLFIFLWNGTVYKGIAKKADEYEKERIEQGKTEEEWYGIQEKHPTEKEK